MSFFCLKNFPVCLTLQKTAPIPLRKLQEELARLLSIDRSFLSSIESGKKGCSVDLFIQLAGFFHISLDDLILGKEHTGTSSKEKVKECISALIDHLESFKSSL